MNQIPAQAAMGWGRSRSSAKPPPRIRLRDVLPPLAAVAVLTLAHIAYGAVQPIAALPLSGLLVAIAITTIFAAGPHHVTSGMIAGAAVIAAYGVTGLAGPLYRSAPHLAILFAAGALWTIGYIASRHRRSLDLAWGGLMWGAIGYCAWMFVLHVIAIPSGVNIFSQAFETPANASLLFGLLATVGMSRILHLIKQMDAEALARPQMIEQMLRQGLSGLLLVGLSLTCLSIVGSRPGMVLTLAVLVALMWWDTLAISTREHRGIPMRLAAILAPFIAVGLAVWGIGLGWISDETITPGVGDSDIMPNMQRIQAYMSAWMESPAFGHGLGSIGAEGDKAMTLFNAKAMRAPGDAHNVFVTWLVEAGIVGLALLVLALGAMYTRIFAALKSRRTPRTFLRLAVVAGALMFLHGVTDSSLDLPSAVWLYALLLGAACGVATGRRIEARADEE
ncbi:MAG: O-antigen ligase family protein [Hyphomonadaceae bacterium]|nr:O-antigen ligase family protein [Hyphomonadaceae bacterium]